MIVCVCNNVSDRKIRAAVADGVTSMRELRTELEIGTCCGKCHVSAKQVLRSCLDEMQTESMMLPSAALA